VRGGIAKNDSMIRVDVFNKSGKFHLVPVYVHHQVKGLPNRAIVAFKDEDEWTLIDDTFQFYFSLYPNDLVKVTQKSNEVILGYYRGCHSGTGAINIALHDRQALGEKTASLALYRKDKNKPLPNDKLGLIEAIGVKLAASIEKFDVDILGNIYPARRETRRELA
jgi:CRISPR-associated endonuclease Csn1